MALLDLGTLKVGVSVSTSDAKSNLDSLDTQLKSTAKNSVIQWDKVGTALTSFGKKMTTYATLPILAAATASIKLASDLQETMNKVDVAFGDNADEVAAWGETTLDNFGLAKQTALDAAATFQDLGTSMGVNNDAATEMSLSLVGLSADLASFKNISIERANAALTGIYTGETEALKSLGIVMNEANLSAFAMSQGIETAYSDMTQAEKVALRYQYVMSATSNAQGDFARTADSAANMSRTLGEKVKELGTKVGEKLLPFAEDILEAALNLLDAFTDSDGSINDAILWGAGIIAAIGPVSTMLGKVIGLVQKVKTGLSAGTLSTSTLGWVGGALALVGVISGVVLSIKGYYDDLYADSYALNDAMETLNTEMANIETTYTSDLASIEATNQLANDYIDTLVRLEEAGLNTKKEQTEYANTIRQLRYLMPELNIELDEQTGLIVGGASALREYTDAWKRQAIVAAILKKQQAQIDAVADATIALTEAQVAYQTSSNEINALMSEQTRLSNELEKATGKTAEEIDNMASGELALFLAQNTDEVRDMYIAWVALNPELWEAQSAQDKLGESVGSAEETLSQANETLDETTEQATLVTEALLGTKDGTDVASEAIEDVGDAANDAAADMEDFSDSVTDMTDNLKEKSEITLKEAAANLEANTKLYQELWENIRVLMERGVDEDFLYFLQQMGVDGWKIIDEMTGATDTQLAEFFRIWKENGEAAAMNWATEIGVIPDETQTALDEAETIATDGGNDVGSAMGDGINSGIAGKIQAIKDKAAAAVSAAIAAARAMAEIKSPSRKMRDMVGKPMAEGIAVGFEAETENVLDTVKSGINNIIVGGSSVTEKAAQDISAKQQARAYSGTTNNSKVDVVQHNTFTSKELTPYEQQLQLRKLNRDLAGSYV